MGKKKWYEYRVIRGKEDELKVPDGWERVVDRRWQDGLPDYRVKGVGSILSNTFRYIVVRREKHWPWYLRWLPCAHSWERVCNESSEYPPQKFLCVKCGCHQYRHTPQSLEPGRDW